MGNYTSKLFYTNESRKESNEHQAVIQQAVKDNTCTPILSEKSVLGDPRSVSAGIRRTPIEVKCIPVGVTKEALSAIPKYLQKKQYLETDMDVVMPPLTPKKRFIPKSIDSDQQFELDVQNYLTPNVNIAKSSKVITPIDKERFIILGLDPRSPAADFDRTPILMPKSLALIKARSQENLSRRGSYEMDVYNSKNSCREIGTSLSIPEIQLFDIASESLKILDMEKEDKLPSTSQYDSNSNISKSEEVTVIKNPKCMNQKKKSNKQKIAIGNEEEKLEDEIEKQDDCKNIKSNTKIKDDKIELSHNSLSSKENVSGKENKKELPREKALGEDIIIMFDEYTTISTSLPKPMKTKERDCRKKGDVEGKRKKDTKTDVKSMLNEKKVFIPENKQRTENRTPLGNRSNNDQMQKKSQLLRNKAAFTRTQQENTPPYKIYAKTRNGTQWDPNSTVFI